MFRTNRITLRKVMALLLCLFLILTAGVGETLAQIATRTSSIINTFLSGLDPTGDLVIRKEVTHPFGGGYALPEELSFVFTVSLGPDYAGKTIQTSQGEKQADENGCFTVTAAPDGAVRIEDLLTGTSVTVTEAAASGFTPDGGPEQSLTIQPGGNTLSYTNVYAPGPVCQPNLTVSGTKLLEGRDWQEGDSFTFLLEYKLAGEDQDWHSAGTASVAYELVEVTDPETGEIRYEPKADFDKFSFTDLVQSIPYDTAGEYAFRVSEVDGTIGGITYDKVVSYFDVTVGDADMDGSLEIQNVTGYQNAAASYDPSTDSYHVDVTVNNKYAPAGTADVTIHIDKSVLSHSGEEKSCAGYTFELYAENGELAAVSGETSAAGETAIGLTFEAKDAGKIFHYTIKETHSGETRNGLTYDDSFYSISVSVVDNLDGTIRAYVYNTAEQNAETVPEETVETEPTEAPTEETTEPTEPAVAPTESVEEPTEETEAPTEVTEEPTVEPTAVDEAPAEEEATEESTVPESEGIEEAFLPLAAGSTPKGKKVTVTPEEKATSISFTFVNVYDPADTSASFSGVKELTGRDLKAGEFTFDLYATGDSFAVAEGMKPIQSVSNAESGGFAFAALGYSTVGTYRYVVKENTSDKLGGVTYDDSEFHVTVTVSDENGILKASVAVTDDLGTAAQICFRNSYKAAAAYFSLTGTKTLTGMDLTAEMFRFQLYRADESYNPLGAAQVSAANDASGQFCFADIACTEAGTFYYVVKEDASDGVEGMTYDDTVYGVKVSVWDDGAGALNAAVALTVVGGEEVDAIRFENSYVKPVDPSKPTDPEPTDPSDPTEPTETTTPTEPEETTKPTKPSDSKTPDTGDNSHVRLYTAVMLASLALCTVLLLAGKRRRKGGKYLRGPF